MKQYLLAVHMGDMAGEPPTPEQMNQAYAAVDVFNAALQAQGAWVFAGGLEMPDTAKVVRQENGQVLVTDGPFAEAKEQLGGFWVIQTTDDAAAMAWAQKATVACGQPVEVRPFQAMPE